MYNYHCSMCSFTSKYLGEFQNHFVRSHKNDPNFHIACSFSDCEFTTKKWVSFRVHTFRKHSHCESTLTNNSLDESCSGDDFEFLEDVYHEQNTEHFNALFTLALEARDRMSKAGVSRVVETTTSLVSYHIESYHALVRKKMEEKGIDTSVLNDIVYESGLDQLLSDKRRNTYYSKNMETYIKPQGIVLGNRHKLINGKLKNVSDIGYIIPFQQNVSNLLNMPEVWHFIQRPHFSDNEYMHDVCDGHYIRKSKFFREHPLALQFAISTDDLEIVNPLGTKIKKHKVAVYYFSLLNIPPMFRSKLNAIQLLAIAKSKDIKYHNAEAILLKDFVTTLNKFFAPGIAININGETHVVYGALIIAAADTLAAHSLGKFKEGVSFALRNCRHCDTESQLLHTKLNASECSLRTTEIHQERCDILDTLQGRTKIYWSKIWGINGRSVLLDIEQFEFIKGLVQDPMHILLEGVVSREMALTLHKIILVEKYITLEKLNSLLSGFGYSYLHTSTRPCSIERNQLDTKMAMKQTSSAMLTLCETLPIILGAYIPSEDPFWINFLKLIQIVLLCTSPYCSLETVGILKILIAEYLSEYQVLYPRSTFTPKLHYLVHFPDQMMEYGPLRHHWCMRYEAKHTVFTQRKHKNFKNLPLTLANQHQLLMCYVQSGYKQSRSGDYLYDGDVVSEGVQINLSERYPLLVGDVNCVGSEFAYSTNSVKIHGLEYRVNICAVVFDYDEFNIPTFGIVRDIIVLRGVKYLVLELTESYLDRHIMYYELAENGVLHIVKVKDLKYNWPLSIYSHKQKRHVMNSKSHCCEMF